MDVTLQSPSPLSLMEPPETEKMVIKPRPIKGEKVPIVAYLVAKGAGGMESRAELRFDTESHKFVIKVADNPLDDSAEYSFDMKPEDWKKLVASRKKAADAK